MDEASKPIPVPWRETCGDGTPFSALPMAILNIAPTTDLGTDDGVSAGTVTTQQPRTGSISGLMVSSRTEIATVTTSLEKINSQPRIPRMAG